MRWRYRLVANGMAVVLPRAQVGRLAALPGVARVFGSARYRPQLDRSPQQIGAPALWGPGLENSGQGLKIAIIDEGIDHTHPFFSPAGYAMPSGFPKGQTAYTNAKVIVARAFPPATCVPCEEWTGSNGFDAFFQAALAGGKARATITFAFVYAVWPFGKPDGIA